ncbi:hypothetical protein [Paratractidigestivibacter sp.]|uniref:hypothetical protein n=1 Tax=Paratractidigestivibacter sp. TaxID=2847316 RepID=UPI002ABE8196|nr:hypothetical protein [Paratractidigestivibacter sp.]
MSNKNNANVTANAEPPMTDEELSSVPGGGFCHHGSKFINGRNSKTIGVYKDALDDFDGGAILYCKCTRCGNPVYDDGLVYRCDKCDDWWWSRNFYT